jgi:hypothetical protein
MAVLDLGHGYGATNRSSMLQAVEVRLGEPLLQGSRYAK